jgi:hypothetical protein
MHAGLVVGFCGALAAAAVQVVALLREPAPAGANPGVPWLDLVLPASGLALLACWLLTLQGQCAGCAAPAEAGASAWAAGAAVAKLLNVLLGGLAVALLLDALPAAAALAGPAGDGLGGTPGAALRPLPLVLGFWLALGSGLAGLAELACTVLFLRAVAGFFERPSLAQRLGGYLRFFLTFLVVFVVFSVGAGLLLGLVPGDPATKRRMLPILLTTEILCFLVLFAQLIGLVKETRDAVAGGGAQGSAAGGPRYEGGA